MTPKLAQTIEDVYQAFSDVPKPDTIAFCDCCIDEEQVDLLLSKPLRELSPDELRKYSGSVFLTCGDVADFLYFLPRILEIQVAEHYSVPDPEFVTRAINESGFHPAWKDAHRQAVLNFFDELINSLVSAEAADGYAIDSWICALGRLDLDLAQFLNRIAEHGPALIAFYEINKKRLAQAGRLSNPFWGNGEEQVIAWFTSPEIRKAINEDQAGSNVEGL
jgi:hypothetical protein